MHLNTFVLAVLLVLGTVDAEALYKPTYKSAFVSLYRPSDVTVLAPVYNKPIVYVPVYNKPIVYVPVYVKPIIYVPVYNKPIVYTPAKYNINYVYINANPSIGYNPLGPAIYVQQGYSISYYYNSADSRTYFYDPVNKVTHWYDVRSRQQGVV